MSLSFLRPLALPRPATFKHFLGTFRAASTSTISSTSPSTTQPTPSTPQTNTTPSTPSKKPYTVTLTNTQNLPIYLLNKRGGNLKQTRIRRIEGDVDALARDLRVSLGVDEKDVVINRVTGHIIVRVCIFLLLLPPEIQGDERGEGEEDIIRDAGSDNETERTLLTTLIIGT